MPIRFFADLERTLLLRYELMNPGRDVIREDSNGLDWLDET